MEKPPIVSDSKPQLKHKYIKLIIILVVVMTFILAVFMFWSWSNPREEKDREVVQKMEALDANANSTCRDVIDSLGSVSTNDLDASDTKIKLLERQMSCFADKEEYDKAISVGEELKELYIVQSDPGNEGIIERRIEDLKATKVYLEKRDESL
jgi:arginyl-tRNA synthetase